MNGIRKTFSRKWMTNVVWWLMVLLICIVLPNRTYAASIDRKPIYLIPKLSKTVELGKPVHVEAVVRTIFPFKNGTVKLKLDRKSVV